MKLSVITSIGSLAIGSLAILAGCDLVETEIFEKCVSRQTDFIESVPQARDLRVQFIYDVAGIDDFLMQIRDIEGLRMTLAQGSSDRALQAFMQDDSEAGPAVFGADDVVLFRTAPITLRKEDVAESGCRSPFEGAQLVRTVWHLTPAPTEEESN